MADYVQWKYRQAFLRLLNNLAEKYFEEYSTYFKLEKKLVELEVIDLVLTDPRQTGVSAFKKIADELTTIVTNNLAEGFTEGFKFNNYTGVNSITYTHNLEKFVQEAADKQVLLINKTSAKQVSTAIENGLTKGGLEYVHEEIDKLYDTYEASRSMKISNTITHSALNRGVYDDSKPHFTYKTWLSSEDERVRPSHALLDERSIPYTERFSNGCMYPGDFDAPAKETINCRCIITSKVAK